MDVPMKTIEISIKMAIPKTDCLDIDAIGDDIVPILDPVGQVTGISYDDLKLPANADDYYRMVGKIIESISNRYPCDYEDAAIIYEAFAKGLLTECRPSKERLKQYAEYCGSAEKFREWIKKEADL